MATRKPLSALYPGKCVHLCNGGLPRAIAQLPTDIPWTENPPFTEFKGAMAENMVLQSLVAHFEVLPKYWTSEATAEMGFLLQNNTLLLPIEIQSGMRLSGNSLGICVERFVAESALRFSMNDLKRDSAIPNIPIFFADWTGFFKDALKWLRSNMPLAVNKVTKAILWFMLPSVFPHDAATTV